jgi:hypothetical protein
MPTKQKPKSKPAAKPAPQPVKKPVAKKSIVKVEPTKVPKVVVKKPKKAVVKDFGNPGSKVEQFPYYPPPDAAPIMPDYQMDSPVHGMGGARLIYRFKDKGLVADFLAPGGVSPCDVTPVNFVGPDITSFVFTGPAERLSGPDDLQRKLKEFA